MAALLVILGVATYAGLVYSNPPPQCFAKFRSDDCGKDPKSVMYYWQAGSRCEVGTWRGCLPNLNMFKDEYECVTTCVFSVRPGDEKFHQMNADEPKSDDPDSTEAYYYMDGSGDESDNSTTTDSTTKKGDNDTTTDAETKSDSDATTPESEDSTSESGDSTSESEPTSEPDPETGTD